jgi:vacuolar-type H+-ATPase subunit F/Vma7
MYKIGIIGDRDTVLGFMALGFSVEDAASADEAAKKLHMMGAGRSSALLARGRPVAFAFVLKPL